MPGSVLSTLHILTYLILSVIHSRDEALRHNEVKSLAPGQALVRARLKLQTSYGLMVHISLFHAKCLK